MEAEASTSSSAYMTASLSSRNLPANIVNLAAAPVQNGPSPRRHLALQMRVKTENTRKTAVKSSRYGV
jgi:hypothetical protein